MMAASEYIEARNGGYYVAGSRVGLDVLIHDFRRGRTAEAILQAYPSIGSIETVEGAVAFMLQHPDEIEAYLREQDRLLGEIKTRYPVPSGMLERFARAKEEMAAKLA